MGWIDFRVLDMSFGTTRVKVLEMPSSFVEARVQGEGLLRVGRKWIGWSAEDKGRDLGDRDGVEEGWGRGETEGD